MPVIHELPFYGPGKAKQIFATVGWSPEQCLFAVDSADTHDAVKIEFRHLIGFVLPLVLALVAQAAENPSGAQLYAKHCAICHDSGAVRVPPAAVLRQIPVSVIVKALQFGVMRAQASGMSSVEQIAVARWLGSKSAVSISVDKLPNRCATTPALSTAAAAGAVGESRSTTRVFRRQKRRDLQPPMFLISS